MANTESGTECRLVVVANRAPGQGGMTAEQASTHEVRSGTPDAPATDTSSPVTTTVGPRSAGPGKY